MKYPVSHENRVMRKCLADLSTQQSSHYGFSIIRDFYVGNRTVRVHRTSLQQPG